ncbi:MAG: SLBB domain-containing protein [Pyrinomonadaceae bacterium]|nr:SLBB domain-containing protein [Pyrinomonadaceae bacterium]
MKSRKFYPFAITLLCIAFLQSSILAQTPTPTPETIAADISIKTTEIGANLVHSGDLIDVDVIGSVEYDWRGTINPEGFLDGVDAAENPIYAICRSEEEIAQDIIKAYEKILREPKVVVKILDRSNRPLAILYGAVKMPQRFQIKRSFFLNELIIVAGGLTETASGQIQIFRQKNLSCQQPSKEKSDTLAGDGESREKFVTARQDDGSNYINVRISDLLSGKKDSNPQILSGDIVTVLEAESIYIIGGVANPKQISARSQITLSRAVASAGGIVKNADAKKITIFRRTAGETKIIEADLEKIKSGGVEDLILQAYDIVEVAQTGREKRRFPPVLKIVEMSEKKTLNMPLRIID